MFQEAVESWGVSGTRAAGSLCVRPAPTPPGAASHPAWGRQLRPLSRSRLHPRAGLTLPGRGGGTHGSRRRAASEGEPREDGSCSGFLAGLTRHEFRPTQCILQGS